MNLYKKLFYFFPLLLLSCEPKNDEENDNNKNVNDEIIPLDILPSQQDENDEGSSTEKNGDDPNSEPDPITWKEPPTPPQPSPDTEDQEKIVMTKTIDAVWRMLQPSDFQKLKDSGLDKEKVLQKVHDAKFFELFGPLMPKDESDSWLALALNECWGEIHSDFFIELVKDLHKHISHAVEQKDNISKILKTCSNDLSVRVMEWVDIVGKKKLADIRHDHNMLEHCKNFLWNSECIFVLKNSVGDNLWDGKILFQSEFGVILFSGKCLGDSEDKRNACSDFFVRVCSASQTFEVKEIKFDCPLDDLNIKASITNVFDELKKIPKYSILITGLRTAVVFLKKINHNTRF